MNVGNQKQRLTFITPKPKEGGYPVPGHDTYTKAWASLKTLKGSTRYAAAQVQMEHNREFTIRYQSKLTDDERPEELSTLWRGKKHSIESIEDVDGLKKEMLVVLKAVS
ncbi:phage head closure protein [Oceanobacillus kimchii]|uniref:phage head closure protein n=1 Tax=Oceanobacillus kimchii TaxID=746691 RepID=UPI00232E8C6C|nr:phage head closure protein [Oceanobacillus kimchii]